MHTIRGHFDGRVVVLDEPVPAYQNTDVLVSFNELKAVEANGSAKRDHDYHWEDTWHIRAAEHIDSTDIIRMIRDAD